MCRVFLTSCVEIEICQAKMLRLQWLSVNVTESKTVIWLIDLLNFVCLNCKIWKKKFTLENFV